jgi:hypothetical protein
MQLENYTNVNIFKRAFEQTQVANSSDMIEHSHNKLPNQAAGPVQQPQFNPYQNNEGTVLGKSLSWLRFKLTNFSAQRSRAKISAWWPPTLV